MNNFTNPEVTNMPFIYELANGNAEARKIYQERYPNRVFPRAKTFRTLHAKICETGSFNKNVDGGRLETVSAPELEKAILDAIEDPQIVPRRLQ